MTDLTFITGNPNKADFLAKHLGMPVAHSQIDLDEIQSLNPHIITEHKVRQAYAILHKPVLVEDAGLVFTAMGNLPGPFIKWFLEELGHDGLVSLADSLPERTAVGRVCYGLYDGHNVHFFEGEMPGSIATQTGNGDRGFGFDAIFVNEGFTKTRAQMTAEEYDRTSYRIPAINKLRAFLQQR